MCKSLATPRREFVIVKCEEEKPPEQCTQQLAELASAIAALRAELDGARKAWGSAAGMPKFERNASNGTAAGTVEGRGEERGFEGAPTPTESRHVASGWKTVGRRQHDAGLASKRGAPSASEGHAAVATANKFEALAEHDAGAESGEPYDCGGQRKTSGKVPPALAVSPRRAFNEVRGDESRQGQGLEGQANYAWFVEKLQRIEKLALGHGDGVGQMSLQLSRLEVTCSGLLIESSDSKATANAQFARLEKAVAEMRKEPEPKECGGIRHQGFTAFGSLGSTGRVPCAFDLLREGESAALGQAKGLFSGIAAAPATGCNRRRRRR